MGRCLISSPFPVRKRKPWFASRNPVCTQESGFHHTCWPASLGWAYFLVGRSDSDARHCCLLCLLCSHCPVPVSCYDCSAPQKTRPRAPVASSWILFCPPAERAAPQLLFWGCWPCSDACPRSALYRKCLEVLKGWAGNFLARGFLSLASQTFWIALINQRQHFSVSERRSLFGEPLSSQTHSVP